ncbi:type II toxin-antitoxin system RelE/ParE family toxin [Sedimenticola hydrogenitrophicus]|uniref:type II toxin-antitoxin system RelE/ParE family toxin n=1 Tax=Sedimenticola hydrogenitrophicus TaxID=2967975 RepID=UPI0021A2CEA3|nr:type II toxin-antitoxin system RelE/ParE family toxin [Sedimenticola hydrogenitrophicus]
MKRVKFLASAREDIRHEKAFYRKISPELAQRFQSAVESAVLSAAENPLSMQVLDFDMRRWPVDGFPHGILYRAEYDFILVLSVFHPSQDPEKWHHRART